MKQCVIYPLVMALACPLLAPLPPATAFPQSSPDSQLLAKERGGGNRSGGNRGGGNRSGGNRSINRSSAGASGSGRVKRDASRQPSNRTVNRDRKNIDRSTVGASGSGRVNKDQARNRNQNANREQARSRAQTVDRDQARSRAQNVDRDRVNNRAQNVDRNQIDSRRNSINRDEARNRVNNNRDFDINNDRNYSNRVNRNLINTGDRTVVVNPRGLGWGGSAWGWNGGRVWNPNYSYWGGGFWGGVAVGAVTAGVTSAIINANNNDPTYIVIEEESPGYILFDSYGLDQVQCIDSDDLVYIFGPQDSLICANPNSVVAAGYYDVNPDDLTLIAR
ncbi:MAG: hypothetical protein RLZZ490_1298 [Cyanobacteriota bacterium]|jgi:hypothetical protein